VDKDQLGDIEWLATCSSRERAAVRKHADFVDLPAGKVIVSEGETARWFYAVVSGQVGISVDGDVIGRLTVGEPINDVDVVRNSANSVTAVTETPVRLLVMGRREFVGMLDEVPGLARRLLVARIPAVPAARRRPRGLVLVPLPAA
jgi:CRP-like cAMP-binding protein